MQHTWEGRRMHTWFWRTLGTPTFCWENIKINIREIRWGVIDWVYLAQDRDQWKALVNLVMILCIPINLGIFLSR
jgi:hypothetical protein